MTRELRRRQVLSGLGGLAGAAFAAQGLAAQGLALQGLAAPQLSGPGSTNLPPLNLLVAGPDGAATSRWGSACALAMGACFVGGPGMQAQPDGGLDGVTGANRLDALVVADGRTGAMLPGLALVAWLTGDDRVHFDPTHWAPVMAGIGSGVLVARLDAGAVPSPGTLRAGPKLRLAAEGPQSNDLAALLALERMGVDSAPVFGLHGREAKTDAFISGEANAVFLCGEGVPEDLAPLAANGGVPIFCIGSVAADGTTLPDPLFPSLPDAVAFSEGMKSPLDAAYHAAAAAARLDFLMVLPKLTDPSAVAQWQAAAAAAIATPGLAAAASASYITLEAAPVAGAQMAAVGAGAFVQAGLQSFLTTRFGWQPG